ncbi:hypothetical protein X947_5377 [Burkholderia pseudomallei MSHR7334]|nr:hypothetical protein X947_5377 [Burkholderia pseudomallei MSHR7334]
MALTIEKRAVLKLAREKIEDGSADFICNALNSAATFNPHLSFAAEEICSYISKKLGVTRYPDWTPTLDEWQIYNGFGDRGREQRRLDRLAWIDWMLNDMQGS